MSIDAIVPEPDGGAQNGWDEAAELLRESLREALDDLEGTSGDDLVRSRRDKFRAMGVFA